MWRRISSACSEYGHITPLKYIDVAKKENTTKSFVLRVDADTMAAIEKWAADEFRSTNGQLQWIIAEALRKSGRLKKTKTNP